MSKTNTANKAPTGRGIFDPKKEAKETTNFIGACLHAPMTPEARENIEKWLESTLTIAHVEGEKVGYRQANEAHDRIYQEVWGKNK